MKSYRELIELGLFEFPQREFKVRDHGVVVQWKVPR